jgi:lipopolysaccharide/colanic/teichoic acid biosynthesis glycosyltransferase
MEQTFYATAGKRVFDSLVAVAGLLLLSPVFVAIALLVKLSSLGPVFYLQERVGRGGKIFRIVKVRSMVVDADQRGLAITAAGDPRITAVGRILRRFKLDELPQLWNVLKGDMSLVGPRPEVPRYVESYSDAQRQVLSVRPGLTDPASILYRHEEELLGNHSDPDGYYREVVLPHKLMLNLEYLRRMSFSYDLSLIMRTTCMLATQPKHSVPNLQDQFRAKYK